MNKLPSQIDPELIRQYADGELDAAARAGLERAVPTEKLQAAVAFEQSLRSTVCRVVEASTPSAPAELRQQIVSAMRDAETAPADEPIGRIEPGAGGAVVVPTPARRFSSMNFVAVAATLVIVAGAVLIGIFGPSIDEWGSQDTGVSAAAEVSEFASSEHDLCAMNPDRRDKKILWKGFNSCMKSMSGDLGLIDDNILVFELESVGYDLMGGGRCKLPDYGQSAHLMYRRDAASGLPAMVSVFVGTPGTSSLQPGQWMQLPQTGGCTHAVYASTDGTVDYLLVCCDADDMDELRAAIGEQLVSTDKSGP